MTEQPDPTPQPRSADASGEQKRRTCEDCKFSLLMDYGYSNYTVEGTMFSCAKDVHPDAPFDRFYGEEPKLFFAEQCQSFEAGRGIYMDVEEENLANLTDEQRKIWNGQAKGTP